MTKTEKEQFVKRMEIIIVNAVKNDYCIKDYIEHIYEISSTYAKLDLLKKQTKDLKNV